MNYMAIIYKFVYCKIMHKEYNNLCSKRKFSIHTN